MSVQTITKENFEALVLQSDRTVLGLNQNRQTISKTARHRFLG